MPTLVKEDLSHAEFHEHVASHNVNIALDANQRAASVDRAPAMSPLHSTPDEFKNGEGAEIIGTAWGNIRALYQIRPDDVTAIFGGEAADADDRVSLATIGAKLTELGVAFNPRELTFWCEECDANGDGMMSFNEFFGSIESHDSVIKAEPLAQSSGIVEAGSTAIGMVAINVAPARRFQETLARREAAKALFNDATYPNGDGDVVKAVLDSGLTYDEMILVVFRTKDTIFSCDLQVVGPKLFDMIDLDGNRMISAEEIMLAQARVDVIQMIKDFKCPILMGLISGDEDARAKSFLELDVTRDGNVSPDEWMDFLENLRTKRLTYFQKSFLNSDHVYAGKGLEPGAQACGLGTNGAFFIRGWWNDFVYYTRNNHPLLLIFYVDPEHPYSKNERRIEFLGALLTTFGGTGILLALGDMNLIVKIYLQVIFITIPVMLFRKITYFLFVAPCLLHDESRTTEKADCCMDCLEACSNFTGYTFAVIWVIIFAAIGIFFWIDFNVTPGSDKSEMALWAYGILQTWVFWFVGVLTIAFLPSPMLSKYLRLLFSPIDKLSCGLNPFVFGKWHVERSMVQALIRDKVFERGVESFFHPVHGSPKANVYNEAMHSNLGTGH